MLPLIYLVWFINAYSENEKISAGPSKLYINSRYSQKSWILKILKKNWDTWILICDLIF